jgi:hypothetical protein
VSTSRDKARVARTFAVSGSPGSVAARWMRPLGVPGTGSTIPRNALAGGFDRPSRAQPLGVGIDGLAPGVVDLPLLASPSTRGGATAPWAIKLELSGTRGAPGARWVGRNRSIGRVCRLWTTACPLCPQLRVYCCIAVSEVVGQQETPALQKQRWGAFAYSVMGSSASQLS